MKILILLADDDDEFRELVRGWMESQHGCRLVGEATDGAAAVTMTLSLQPDVVLMDVSMPNLNGIDATRQIIERRPTTVVVGISIHADMIYREEMSAAGASAYILKENMTNDLPPTLDRLLPDFGAARNAEASSGGGFCDGDRS